MTEPRDETTEAPEPTALTDPTNVDLRLVRCPECGTEGGGHKMDCRYEWRRRRRT